MHKFKSGDIVWDGISMVKILSVGDNNEPWHPYHCLVLCEEPIFSEFVGREDDWKFNDNFRIATEAEIILYAQV